MLTEEERDYVVDRLVVLVLFDKPAFRPPLVSLLAPEFAKDTGGPAECAGCRDFRPSTLHGGSMEQESPFAH